jgi:peptide/nickel transport system permease protein
MKKYILKRIGLSAITVSIVAIIVFFMTHVLPGNVARKYLGRDATLEDMEYFNKMNGLDRPLFSQLTSWIGDLLSGNLGNSMQTNRSVTEMLTPALQYSAKLAGLAFVVIIPISILGGIAAAMKRGKILDRIVTVGGLSAAVIPEFIWAVVLVLLFGVTFQIFPVTAFPDEVGAGIGTQIFYLTLPSISLLLVLFGYIARITRAGVIESLESDYVRTAVLKGLSRRKAVLKHALRNALLPTIAVIANQIPYLIGGLVAVEIVFNYPGFGTLLLSAVSARDYAILQSGVMITSTVIVLFQLVADILFAVLNPRIRQRISE